MLSTTSPATIYLLIIRTVYFWMEYVWCVNVLSTSTCMSEYMHLPMQKQEDICIVLYYSVLLSSGVGGGLLTELKAQFWQSWLASKHGIISPSPTLKCWGYRHLHPCPTFTLILGI